MAMIHLEPQTAQMFSRALGALKPPPNLTLSQWADNYRRLSAEASAAQGRWNTDNAPFQREIMDAIGDVHIRKVVAMMCAQSGKTDGLILNTIGYYMSYYPAPIMIVQPTVNLGESFSKDRLATMIRDTPVLRGLVDNKSRYSGNTIMKKNFAGGQLTIVGANAPTDLRGRPIKVLLADEVDAYKASAGKEGDPVMLAEQRQTTYWDYKTVLVSTPTDKNNSRILDEFNASTQEEWTVPCPNCGFYQPFVWDNMVFDKDKWPEGGVQYRCAECGCLDNEYRWKKNSLKGKWHAEHPERAVRGFHMNKIGSTLCGWDKIVEDFIAADLDAKRGDYEKMENILKVFLMAFPEWLACIFMVVGLVVTALAAVRLGYGLVVAKTVYKWIVNAEEKFGSGAGAEKKAHVIAVLRGYTPDWLDWAINERTLDWIVQLVFDFTKKKLEDYMAKKSAETTTVAHFGNVGENKRND